MKLSYGFWLSSDLQKKLQDHSIWCSFEFWIEYFHIGPDFSPF